MPTFNVTTGKLNILANSQVSTSSNALQAGPTNIDGKLVITGGGIVNTGTLTGAGEIDLFSEPGLVTGDAGSGTFSGVLNGFATLTKQGSGVWTVSGTNNALTGPIIVSAGTLKVTGSVATSSGVTVNDGFFEAGATQTVSSLTLANTGNAKITPSAHPSTPNVVTLNNLIINSATSAVDVTNNAMILENTTPDNVRALIISGRHNGAWNGPGINSSTAAATPSNRAVGYASAASLLNIAPGGNGTWLGQPVDSSSVLVRSTILGDSNLDGSVSFADLVAVAQHYGTSSGATWQNGDFNYDGIVSFADLVAVAQNYGGALPSDAIPGAPANFNADMAAAFSSVPEPGGLTLVAAAAGLLSARVRRRKAK
jgi:autotransporter-associated beta strand protein